MTSLEHTGRLQGKTIIVTGAGSGLARATATMCAAAGARVFCADINESAVADTAEQIFRSGGKASAHYLDVTDINSTQAVAAAAIAAAARIDALMNFAGIAGNGTAMDTDPAVWDKVIATNLTGVWLMCRAVLPTMVQQGAGSIINMASVGALVGIPANASYIAPKAGAVGLTRQIAVDFAPNNIRANAICPGTVPTPLVINHYVARGEVSADQLEAGLAATRKRYPLGRHGKPEEIAALAVYLASDESAFMTGSIIPIDGGLSAAGWQVGQ